MGTIAVSGSASGIGAATATRLLRAGHTVIGIDRHRAEVVADLSTVPGRQEAVAAVLDRCGGRLDGLVTAAGLARSASPEAIVSVNYFGTTALLDGLRDALAASGRGRAVAFSSVLARLYPAPVDVVAACMHDDEAGALRAAVAPRDLPDGRIYIATKVAVARWVRRHAPRPEWAGAGIRLNAIAPGPVDTPLLVGDGQTADEILPGGSPVGRLGHPDEIAAWVEPMLGEQAEFLCGSVLFVDGGLDARYRPNDWPSGPHRDGSRTEAGTRPRPRRQSFFRRGR